jgi:hypothetical protein
VQGILAAAISPDNTPHGYNLTFAFPELLFIVVAAALYLRFRSPHRVPGHGALPSARQATATAVAPAAEAPAQAAGPANGDTTDGSTLHEGDPGEDAGQEASAEESTEDSE